MKNIKKLILLAAIVACSSLTAKAQNWQGRNFLGPVTSMIVSNTIGYTNLMSTASAPGTGFATTNIVGLTYTNILGNQVVVAGTNFDQLTTDVPLWSDRNGRTPLLTSYTNLSDVAVTIHLITGGSGANSAVNFVFSPVFDGLNESTTSGDYWTVGVTANTTSAVTISTNVPLYKWPGAKSLRLRTITNTDTDATSQSVVGSVIFGGFVP